MERSPQPGTVDATDRRCPAAAGALLARALDYAGRFPPAALPVFDAVAESAAADGGPDSWMLGRFVVPAVRRPEFAAEAGAAGHAAVWKPSALAVPFKATAGLHHALRGSCRSTYEAGSAAAPMYGSLTMLFATAVLLPASCLLSPDS